MGHMFIMFNCLLALYTKYYGYHYPTVTPRPLVDDLSGSFGQILSKEGPVVFVGSGANECCTNWITMTFNLIVLIIIVLIMIVLIIIVLIIIVLIIIVLIKRLYPL